MEELKLKKAIFNPTEIVIIDKKENATIHVDDINCIIYDMPKLWDYIGGAGVTKLFSISLNKEINGKTEYALRINRKDVLKLQDFSNIKYYSFKIEL